MTIPAVDIPMRATFGGLLIKPGYVYDGQVFFDGSVIPPDSILFQDEGRATSGTTVSMQDTSKTWPLNGFVGFKVRNTSDGSESIITSNGSTQLFFGPLSGGFANSFSTNHYYEIVIDIDTGDEIRYSTTSSIGGTVSMTDKGQISIIGVSANHGIGYYFIDVSTAEQSPNYEVIIAV